MVGIVMLFVIVDCVLGCVIGSICFWKIDCMNCKLEIGYMWLSELV